MKIERDKYSLNVVNCSTHDCSKRKTSVKLDGIFMKPVKFE